MYDGVKMLPKYDLDKIKFATDAATFQRAVALYESGKVTEFEDNDYTYTATVLGTQPYKVFVSNKKYDMGGCDCYLGKNDTLCKHLVALAIYAVKQGEKLAESDKTQITKPTASNFPGELSETELKAVKQEITAAVKYIKYYSGPSRTWFVYQNSLQEGCNRLSTIISKLPISEQTASLIVDLLIRSDKKLQYGVDDSDGTIGGFIEESVEVLKQYAQLDHYCLQAFYELKNRETCFGWEESLLTLIKK